MSNILDTVLQEVKEELLRAAKGHAPMNSAHEGYAVIREELEAELWQEIVKKKPNKARMREEALQVAAMGIRFILDICHDKATANIDKHIKFLSEDDETGPGKDCTICECPRCTNTDCSESGKGDKECEDVETCDCPVEGCTGRC